MNVVFLTGLYPKEQEQEIFENCINGVQTATDALQWSFVDGFYSLIGDKVDLITLPYVGSYPKRNKKLFFRNGEFVAKNGLKYHSVKFCNLSMYKMYSRYLNSKRVLLNKYKNSKDTILVLYSVSTPFLKAARDLKRRNPNIKLCVIIADLPQFMSDSKDLLYRVFKNIDTKTVYKNLKYVDSFVLLSKHMTEMLPINNKPFVIIEGIYNPNDEVFVDKESNEKKIVLYSGTLARRYGIMNLVNAVMNLKDQSVLLYICGEGDSKQDIMELALKDHRIQYKGNLTRQQVLELQRKSTLLVNPRTPEGIYTKYSFPSKTMEYLASGVATLLYKLPGIPDEYYKYCYTIDELGVEALAVKLNELLNMPKTALVQKGVIAREFILTHKNPQSQCVKVIEMLREL